MLKNQIRFFFEIEESTIKDFSVLMTPIQYKTEYENSETLEDSVKYFLSHVMQNLLFL